MGYWATIVEVRHALMVDLDPVAIDLMAYRTTHEEPLTDHRKRFFFLQESYEDSYLPADWADLIIYLNGHQWMMQNHEEDPVMERYWAGVVKALAKGGRLVIADLCSREGKACPAVEKIKKEDGRSVYRQGLRHQAGQVRDRQAGQGAVGGGLRARVASPHWAVTGAAWGGSGSLGDAPGGCAVPVGATTASPGQRGRSRRSSC